MLRISPPSHLRSIPGNDKHFLSLGMTGSHNKHRGAWPAPTKRLPLRGSRCLFAAP